MKVSFIFSVTLGVVILSKIVSAQTIPCTCKSGGITEVGSGYTDPNGKMYIGNRYAKLYCDENQLIGNTIG